MAKKHSEDELYKRVMVQLCDHAADQNLDNLVRAGASRTELLRWLSALAGKKKLQRLSSRRAKSLAAGLRQAADLIASLNMRSESGPLFDTIHVRRDIPHRNLSVSWKHVNFSYREILCWPQAIHEYANRVENLPNHVEARWNPLETAAISHIEKNVKQSTGGYHDKDVEPLISAIIGREPMISMKQWRKRNSSMIPDLASLDVIPILPRRPRSR